MTTLSFGGQCQIVGNKISVGNNTSIETMVASYNNIILSNIKSILNYMKST